jgi:hypothetical protein
MAKYYVQMDELRLVLDAESGRDAALRAIRWCHDRRAEIFREPAGDRIRDVEVLQWQIGRKIRVSETGFDGSDGDVYDTAALPPVSRRPASRAIGADC